MPRGKRKGSGAAAARRAGTAHFNGGRHEKALSCFRRAFALGDRGPELRTFIAHALNSCGRTEEAIAEFSAVTRDFPAYRGAGLAPVALLPERLPGVEKALREALAADPRNGGARLGLLEVLRVRGQAALTGGDPGAAEKLLREALALKPRRDAARLKALEVLRSCGLSHLLGGRLDEAERVFRGLLKDDSRDARACLSLAAVMRARARPVEERRLLSRALRLERGELPRADRFRALMKLGRHKEAVAAAERILDEGPSVNDLRVFWDPWEWDDRLPRSDRLKELKRLERALGRKPSPWLHYYRAELLGPDGAAEFQPIAAFPRARYGWMFAKAGLSAHCGARFEQAVAWFKLALEAKPADWRTHGFLAEAYLCLRRPAEAFAEMEKARRAAAPEDAGQALAWSGALDLWLGRYEEALVRLEKACALDAPCAYSWRAAALLKLGRPAEALEKLDDALRRYPRDFEAYVWRGEAKRELGLYAEALRDLNEEKLAVPKQEPPIWLWALVNRALVKAALGDGPGLKADFDALPAYFVDYVRAKTGLSDREAVLRASLDLSRGFRREEYRQAIWMI
jgi:tetratricopeptide (TPR) repeat protein